MTFLEVAGADDDGRRDVVAATDDQTIRLLTNRGSEGFPATPRSYLQSLGTIARHGVVAELDSDGEPELAVTAFNDNNSRNELIVLELDRVPATLDLNGNGLPDECEGDCSPGPIAPGGPSDCDGDGISDACELSRPILAFRAIETGPASDDRGGYRHG